VQETVFRLISSCELLSFFEFSDTMCMLYIRIPPPPGGTAILPEYIHYYGYYYQVIVQCLSTELPASRLRILTLLCIMFCVNVKENIFCSTCVENLHLSSFTLNTFCRAKRAQRNDFLSLCVGIIHVCYTTNLVQQSIFF
jgi:hypothetical protein